MSAIVKPPTRDQLKVQVQWLEREIERLREEVATMSGKDHEKIMRLTAALNAIEIMFPETAAYTRRALEDKT